VTLCEEHMMCTLDGTDVSLAKKYRMALCHVEKKVRCCEIEE